MGKEMPTRTENKRDYGVFRRRLELMYWLSEVRETHYVDIQNEFHIHPTSVSRDLKSLVEDFDVPLKRVRGNYVRVADGWYASRPHIKPSESDLLYELLDVVPDIYIPKLKDMIRAYGNPTGLDE